MPAGKPADAEVEAGKFALSVEKSRLAERGLGAVMVGVGMADQQHIGRDVRALSLEPLAAVGPVAVGIDQDALPGRGGEAEGTVAQVVDGERTGCFTHIGDLTVGGGGLGAIIPHRPGECRQGVTTALMHSSLASRANCRAASASSSVKCREMSFATSILPAATNSIPRA